MNLSFYSSPFALDFKFVCFFKILYRPLCTLRVLCVEVATLVTFSVPVISSARLICKIPPTTYMNKLFCFQTPFAFHASQLLLVSEVNQPRDGLNSQPKSDISAV